MRLVLLLVLIPLSAFGQLFPGPKDYATNGCRIYAPAQLVVRVLPGERCLFFDNGDFISSGPGHIRYYSSLGEVKWEVKGHFHHQMNFSNDRQRILAISSVVGKVGRDELKRYDLLMILGIDGKIHATLALDRALEEAGINPILQVNQHKMIPIESEGSHLNSFYEIPPLKRGVSAPDYVAPGSFVVNGLRQGVLFIDKELKRITKQWVSPFSMVHSVHDAQITERGQLIYFNNFASLEKNKQFSTIDEVDLKTSRKVLEIKSGPEAFFYSRHSGSVQVLNDDLVVFSHVVAGYYVYSRSRKAVIFSSDAPYVIGDKLVTAQQIRIQDLSEFLRKR